MSWKFIKRKLKLVKIEQKTHINAERIEIFACSNLSALKLLSQ